MYIFQDPVTLHGQGQYNLNNLRNIEVTKSFLGLDEDVKKCQNKESYDNCTTNYYHDNIRKKCGCLQLTININGKVYGCHKC